MLKTNSRTFSRGGFSLFELLIVMAIIAALAAIATPNVMQQIRENAVFRRADEVREAMGVARRTAIETGIDYEFRYEIEGPAYIMLPSELAASVTEQNESASVAEYAKAVWDLETEGMKLRPAEGVDAESETLDAELLSGLGGGAELSRKQWSKPIMFRFDGRSDDASLRVSDESGLTSDVTLRGLTGTARISVVYPGDD